MTLPPRRTPPHDYETWPERTFQTEIIDMATYYGFTRKFHNLYAVGSDKGYPDLTLVKPGWDTIWLEVKGKAGTVSQAQIDWIVDLQRTSHHAYIVYPRNLPLVEAIMRGEIVTPSLGDGYLDAKLVDIFVNQQKATRK